MRKLLINVLSAAACSLALAAPAMAAPFTVDDLDDASDAAIDGVCDATGADTCTLRAAADEANFTGAADTITVSVPGTINLALGSLTIGDVTTVNGNAGGTTVDAGDASRVLVTTGASVTLNDLTLQDGLLTDNDGAGIFSGATLLTLNRVTVASNTVNSASGGSVGAGIRTQDNTTSLVLNDSTVTGNTITGLNGLGAGIRAQGPLTLNRSTVSGNTTTLDAGGRGGGIDMSPSSSVALSISNSTISGNSSGGLGGGGVFAGANVSTSIVVGSTIAGNSTLGGGGGVRLNGSGTTSENTIYAGNTAGDATTNCNLGTNFTAPENNIDTGTSCGFGTGSGNQEDVTAGALGLGALAPNGGPTQTRAIASGSVAQNAASGDCGGLGTDQRGVLRPQGTGCDVGAFELEPPPPAPPPATPGTPAPAKKKCKKGRKLKKGKCVKKKKRKKK